MFIIEDLADGIIYKSNKQTKEEVCVDMIKMIIKKDPSSVDTIEQTLEFTIHNSKDLSSLEECLELD